MFVVIEKAEQMIKGCLMPLGGMVIGLSVAAWLSSFMPQESSFQIAYHADGSATAEYVVTHHDGDIEKCTSFFKTTNANSYGVHMRPSTTSCVLDNISIKHLDQSATPVTTEPTHQETSDNHG